IPFTSAFSLHPLTGEISLRLHFHVEHFSDAQIASIVEYFEKAIAAIVAAPDQRILGASLLSEAEIGLTAGSRAERSLARAYRPVSALFLDAQRRHPDSVAMVRRDQHITYEGMRRRVDHLHGVLVHHSVASGGVVGIYETDASRAIASMLAVNRAGACFVI